MPVKKKKQGVLLNLDKKKKSSALTPHVRARLQLLGLKIVSYARTDDSNPANIRDKTRELYNGEPSQIFRHVGNVARIGIFDFLFFFF